MSEEQTIPVDYDIGIVFAAYLECALWSSSAPSCNNCGAWLGESGPHDNPGQFGWVDFDGSATCLVYGQGQQKHSVREDTSLDEEFNLDDFADDTRANLYREVVVFVIENLDDLASLDPAQVGHDFWLTRNGHGTGFWDRGLGDKGDRLTKAAKVYGSVDLYPDADGKVHA